MDKEPYAFVYSSSSSSEEEISSSDKDEGEGEEEEEAAVKNTETAIPKPKAKRQIEEGEIPEAKKSKKQLIIQRLWSDDDEITLLEGLISYSQKGVIENDKQSLYNHIKKSLKLNVNKSQTVDKIRRLKKKYENILKVRGINPSFQKPHEQKLFQLSKKLWGISEASTSAAAAAATAKSNSKDLNLLLFDKMSKNMQGVEEFVVSHGMEMIGGEKKAELMERWKKLETAQLELFLQRNELINDQAKFILESMSSV